MQQSWVCAHEFLVPFEQVVRSGFAQSLPHYTWDKAMCHTICFLPTEGNGWKRPETPKPFFSPFVGLAEYLHSLCVTCICTLTLWCSCKGSQDAEAGTLDTHACLPCNRRSIQSVHVVLLKFRTRSLLNAQTTTDCEKLDGMFDGVFTKGADWQSELPIFLYIFYIYLFTVSLKVWVILNQIILYFMMGL